MTHFHHKISISLYKKCNFDEKYDFDAYLLLNGHFKDYYVEKRLICLRKIFDEITKMEQF